MFHGLKMRLKPYILYTGLCKYIPNFLLFIIIIIRYVQVIYTPAQNPPGRKIFHTICSLRPLHRHLSQKERELAEVSNVVNVESNSPLYNPPVLSAEHGRGPHLKHTSITMHNDNYFQWNAFFSLYKRKNADFFSLNVLICFVTDQRNTARADGHALQAHALTSVLSQQQQVALQHWSPVSFWVKELGTATENMSQHVSEWFITVTRWRSSICWFSYFSAGLEHSWHMFKFVVWQYGVQPTARRTTVIATVA